MNKKKFILLLGFIIIAAVVALLVVFYNESRDVDSSMQDIDWNNYESVFDVKVPEDFDEYMIERLDKKLADAKQLYNEKRDHNWTWVVMGDMYDFARDYDRAVLAYKKATDMEPRDFIAPLNVATIYEKYLIDYEKAEEYYEKAIQAQPGVVDLYDRLAKFYWRKVDRLEDAESVYKQGLERVGEHPKLLIGLIKFYDKNNRTEEKLTYVKRLLELYPDDEMYRDEYGHLIE